MPLFCETFPRGVARFRFRHDNCRRNLARKPSPFFPASVFLGTELISMRATHLLQHLLLTLTLGLVSTSTAWAQSGPALVRLGPVVQREVSEGQTFVGTVMPSRRAVVGSAVDGRVVEFPVNEGDRVEDRQMLAQLLTETIGHEVKAAEAELALRKKELEELENGARPDEKAEALARMEAAKAAAEYQKVQRERTVALFRQRGAATDQQVDEATWRAQQADQQEKEAAAAWRLIEEGPRAEQIEQARARMLMQQSVLDRLNDQLSKHTIISRFDGYVVAEHTEIGQWVSRGDPVAEVVALDQVDIEAKVVESQVPYVRIGDEVLVHVPAVPSEALENKPLTGKVISVVPQADVRSRKFPVKVRVENKFTDDSQPVLKSGMLAQVVLPTGPQRDALLVHKDALVLGGRQPMIYTVDPSTAQKQAGSEMLSAPVHAVPVELGVADGDLIQVIGDVSVDVSVVVLGNERITPPRPGGPPSMVQWVPSAQGE
jgi:HlyD family secretion protein